MRTPTRKVLGGSAITALTISGLVALGIVVDPIAPSARAATGLRTFEDCDALQEWYVSHTIDQVGPYGWGGRAWTTMRGPDVAGSSPLDATGGAEVQGGVANGATGTNTQEAGVDEPDRAKTNGRLVVRLTTDQRLVLTDVSGPAPRDVSDWQLPDGSHADALLLVGDHVLLSGDRPFVIDDFGGSTLMPEGMGSGRLTTQAGATLLDVDVSDPAHPRLSGRIPVEGRQLSLRQYGDTVRLVTASGLPSLPFAQPRPGQLTPQQAERHNREVVRASTVEDWAPGLDCRDVYHPRTWTGSDTVVVSTFRPGSEGASSKVAVTGAGDEVYSSPDRLYVTSTAWAPLGDRPMVEPGSEPGSIVESLRPTTSPRTQIHAFALQGAATRYVASGSVTGSIRDRWSLDEHDGHLRVAVTRHDRAGSDSENAVAVLDERDGRLEQVGELSGLGVGEEIKSVRWFDDLAVLVTFRQMDPLYTIDLADPKHPRTLGELKIPGFSSYLHPIGRGRLLGLGTDASTDGQALGAQAAVFDLSDATLTSQVDKVTFGTGSHLAASEDPHAFTWLPGSEAAITTLDTWATQSSASQSSASQSSASQSSPDQDGSAMVLLRVSPSGRLSWDRLPSPGGWQPRALPLPGDRVALVGTMVRIVEVPGLG